MNNYKTKFLGANNYKFWGAIFILLIKNFVAVQRKKIKYVP